VASPSRRGVSKNIGPGPWADLRSQVYKAVRAAAAGPESPEDRRELLDHWLSPLFQQDSQKVSFREELAKDQQALFQAGLKRAVNRCRGYAGAWFAWESLDPETLVREVKQAVSRVAREDEIAQVLINGPDLQAEEVPRLLKYSLRQRWCGDAEAPDTFRVEKWLQDVAFFNRELMEIGSWARIFHTVALLHREGVKTPELRRQALLSVQEKVINGRPLESLREVVIYLEGRVKAGEYETSGESLAPRLEPGLFPGEPQNVCLLLRLGLVFLVAGGRRHEQQQRLAWLAKHQDLNDLRDLLLLFLAVLQGQDPLPPPSEVLDLLQRQGYPIHHQDFSDEYRAFLVPLEDLPGVLEVTLSWPLDPGALTGDPEQDLSLARDQAETRRLWLQAFKEEALAYWRGRENPLPYAELIRPAARFVAVWLAVRQYQERKPLDLPAQVQEAVNLLPPPLLKLIRPRKGYELTHRSQLERLLQQEFQAYHQVLSRCCRFGCLANKADEGSFFHLAAALALARRQSDLEALRPEEVLGLEVAEVLDNIRELADTFSLDLEPAAAPYWHEFKDWLKEKLDWPSLEGGAEDSGRLPVNWKSGADTLFPELAGQLYRLVVAKARAERGLPLLQGDHVLLTWLADWLTPERRALLQASGTQLLNTVEAQARQAVWESYPLVVESREELVALSKYYLALELKGRDLETYSRAQPVGALAPKAAAGLKRCHIPPEIAGPGGVDAVIQEVLRPRALEATEAQRQLEEKVLALLPRTDCGSCGSPGCLAFARLLVQGRAQPSQCLTSPAATKTRLTEILAQAPAVAPEPYVLRPEEIRLLSCLLDPYFVALRHRLAQELDSDEREKIIPFKKRGISILQIGKSPDVVTFQRYLEDYLGYDAANRLTRTDQAFLADYGDLRLAAATRELEDSFSWVAQETRTSLSKFALAEKDLARQAAAHYDRCFFLSDLSTTDRTRIQEFRRQRFLCDFLEDWEQSLTELWQAGSRIEDWQDFSRIVAKSYWHQEFTPAPKEIMRALGRAIRERLPEWGISLGERLVKEQWHALETRRVRLVELLRRRWVTTPADMEFLVRGFVDRAWQDLTTGTPPPGLPSPDPVFQLSQRAFNQLDQANLHIAGDLRIHWDELSWRVREILGADANIAPEELARLQASATGLTWREMSTLGRAWIEAQIAAAGERLLLEEVEVERFLKGDLPFPSPHTLCRAVCRLFGAGKKGLPDLMEALHAAMQAYPQGWQALGEAALVQLIWGRLASGRFRFTEPDADNLVRKVDRLLRAHVSKNVHKLKAYMFLLAKMEGNLDKLTALLREIRETSDIIEAAWLDFTKERIAPRRSPHPEAAEGKKLPLLLARLDPARLNRYLEDGMPRGEPREYRRAYEELITILEFYVVSAAPQDSPQEIFQRLQSGCYDLTGIPPQSLLKTIQALYQQRDRLLPRKISICTYVLGHRLAGTEPHLAQNEDAFLSEKNAFLKFEALPAELHKGQLAGNWGVELGKVRNALYLQVSDLLEQERTESFANRIGQIIERLEDEYAETLDAFQKGEFNRVTAFYIFRRFQKDQSELSGADLGRFLKRHQPETLAQLRSRYAPRVVAEVDGQLEKILSRYRGALLG
jgi:hypothetical protein